MSVFSSRVFLTAVSATALLSIAPTFAQESHKADEITEIVVTAQRRAESILSVPLSISATTGEQLVNSGIKGLEELQFTTPGYLPSESGGAIQIYIRGIGNNNFVSDPSVATYVDDVPHIYGTAATNLFDVERVEVIKGAPGGLYGRNSTGGAVNIITQQPSTDKFQGNARISYGEKDTLAAAAYVNVPVSDKVAFSVSAQRETRDYYTKNTNTNPTPYTAAMFPLGSVKGTPQQTADFFNSGVHKVPGVSDQDFKAISGKLLLKVADNFKVTVAADMTDKHDTIGMQQVNVSPAATQSLLAATLAAFNPVFPAGFISTAGTFQNGRGSDTLDYLKDYGFSVTGVLNLSSLDLTSITAVRSQLFDQYVDVCGCDVPILNVRSHAPKRNIYQEFRAVSNLDGPFQYIAGATYLSNRVVQTTRTEIAPPLTLLPTTKVKFEAEAWSVYGQAGYEITKALNLTTSLRYVHEKDEGTTILQVASLSSFVEKKLLPSATLSYKLDQGGNVYARWARGFKAGGINFVVPASVFPTDLGLKYGGETVDTYEVGVRAPLLGHKVQFTAAAFYNDYRNLQVKARGTTAYPQITQAVVNAGSAETYGGEATMSWHVAEPLTLGASVGYLHAKYGTYVVPPNPILQSVNYSGFQMTNAPKWQMAFTADLDQPLNDKFRVVGNVMTSHISSVIYNFSGLTGVLPNAVQPGYWIANARLGLRTSDDKWEVAVAATNLFNKTYFTSGSSSSPTGTVGTWGNPRIVRGEVSVRF